MPLMPIFRGHAAYYLPLFRRTYAKSQRTFLSFFDKLYAVAIIVVFIRAIIS